MKNGKLFILSAPSGTGKTSLVKQLTADIDRLVVSISHTTRQQRPGENHGSDYFFISHAVFQEMCDQQAFLENAQVYDNCYGTAKQTVNEKLSLGIDVILEIDWQGGQQVRKALPDCISIFILPPSVEVLQQRLRNRGQDNEATIVRRMADAVKEMSHFNEYDYLVVNNNFNTALNELKSIVLSNRLKKNRKMIEIENLIQELLHF